MHRRLSFAALLMLVVWQLALAQQTGTGVLRWEPNPAPYPAAREGYRVYRGTQPGQTNMVMTDLVITNLFTDNSMQAGVRYYYAVTALYADGMESLKSNEVTGLYQPGGGCN